MSRLRLAVIGAGHLGRLHAKLATQTELFQLVGIVDPSEESRRQVAQQLDVPVFEQIGSLASSIDAAVVAAPSVHHHVVAKELLDHGIHLLVEKPLAVTSEQAQDLVEFATERGVILQVGHIEQFNPAVRAARLAVERPLYIESVRTSGFTFRSTDIGAVLDLMIHDLDIILSFVKAPIREIHALGTSVMGGHEDMAQARLHFENGCVANLTASRTSFKAQRTMQIFGQDVFGDLDFAEPALRLIHRSDQLSEGRFDVAELLPEQRQHFQQHLFDELLPIEEVDLESTNPLLDELKDFGHAILSGHPVQVTGLQGYHAVKVAERVLAAIDEHASDVLRHGFRVAGNHVRTSADLPITRPVRPIGQADQRRKAG